MKLQLLLFFAVALLNIDTNCSPRIGEERAKEILERECGVLSDKKQLRIAISNGAQPSSLHLNRLIGLFKRQRRDPLRKTCLHKAQLIFQEFQRRRTHNDVALYSPALELQRLSEGLEDTSLADFFEKCADDSIENTIPE